MNSDEIRQRFLGFFERRGHKIIPSAPLVPENDPSVLFTTAGMQPLVPYLLGERHPAGDKLVNIQKCVRTQDIDEVGDATHDTFFEMMGNWSLGSYFKEEAIKWSYELLTGKDEGFGLDPNRLYVTVFAGDANAPRDEESTAIWQKVGIPASRIYYLPAAKNWWSPGDTGPCGPDTEIFYDVTERGLGEMTHEQYVFADDNQEVVEIWNNVFMEYEKKDGVVVGKLKQKNVDTGAGLERFAMVMQGKNNIFDTDLFRPVMDKIESYTSSNDIRAKRIVADHLRTAVFMLADGVLPSNTDRGYILRRLLRRAVRYADVLGMKHDSLFWLSDTVIEKYQNTYSNLKTQAEVIKKEISQEETRFRQTLSNGLREFAKLSANDISGVDAFLLFSSYGFPLELTLELAKEKEISVDEVGFQEEMKKHQELSRAGAEQKFKGGLAGHGEKEVQYHTATHLLHQALHDVLGDKVEQKGSNITAERLRFDFSHSAKMTDDEKKKVEEIVNTKIKEALPVNSIVLPKAEAEKIGARHFFGDKYGDEVTVYYVGPDLATAYSKEFCGGPHVKNTADLKGTFKILKEEAVAAGIRRIKAVLE